MSALSNKQKRILSQLAERAFNKAGALARGRGDVWDGSRQSADEFRHQEVATAVQKAGLRCCDQDDYKQVEAHFHRLLGEDGKAFNDYVRGQPEAEAKRQMEWLVTEACGKYGYHLNFAAALCLRIHKVSLMDADAAVLKKVLFTINTKGRKKMLDARAHPTTREGACAPREMEGVQA